MPRTGNRPASDHPRASRGRPRVSPLTRTEQLREAKRRQRTRDRQRGLETVSITLGARHAEQLRRLVAGSRSRARLLAWLDRLAERDTRTHGAPLIDVTRYPELRLLTWNRAPGALLTAREALSLYEANWRFVDRDRLTAREVTLIRRLVRQYGGGVLHVAAGTGFE